MVEAVELEKRSCGRCVLQTWLERTRTDTIDPVAEMKDL